MTAQVLSLTEEVLLTERETGIAGVVLAFVSLGWVQVGYGSVLGDEVDWGFRGRFE